MWHYGANDRLCLLLVCRGATLAGGDGASASPAGADGAGERLPAGQGEGRAGQLPGQGEPPLSPAHRYIYGWLKPSSTVLRSHTWRWRWRP